MEGLTELDLRKQRRPIYAEFSVDVHGEMVPATVVMDINEGEHFGGDEIKCSICLGITSFLFVETLD